MPLWASETRIGHIRNASSAEGTDDGGIGTQDTQQPIELPDPAEDATRMMALKKLRHKLVTLCSEHGDRTKPPTLAFERWLGRAALRRKPGDDPIIPSDLYGNDGMLALDKALTRDLSRTLPSWEASSIVAKEMTKEASKQIRAMEVFGRDGANEDLETICKKIENESRVVKKATKRMKKALESQDDQSDEGQVSLREALVSLQRAASSLNDSATNAQRAIVFKSNPDGDGNIVFNGKRREGIYDVMRCGPGGKPRRPYLTVSSLHLSKLLRLWKIHNKTSTDATVDCNDKLHEAEEEDPIKAMNALPDDERIVFQKSLYCCLARYEGLKGAGYQCAVPGIAFDAAVKMGLGTTIECFASPLNCRYERFCSAFPDIETRFGSLGSFFDDDAFDPFEGSFEANPPFVPETMIAMGTKLERLLSDQNRGPLSFLVIVPNWGAGIEFVKNLLSSAFVRASSCIKASDHAFYDGAQHTKPLFAKNRKQAADPDLRPSSWDTAVILLQNDFGASKWNVDNAKLEESFCSALRASVKNLPKKFATLSAWERRGVGQGGSRKRQHHQHGTSDRVRRIKTSDPMR
ncbi:unnamed protein product [Pseudo-nitzschia multistriata]|uniref:PCIF1 WW domain-containing protein n=1 Tax=Pseudo-nitzschia multistriata TaxID=183589 RepID=A0A448ZF85_9STRA|nr:unnamed protein product [Pseudo-nitzschia multistriata]